jgi:two-component system, sensor histidine kinase RegB
LQETEFHFAASCFKQPVMIDFLDIALGRASQRIRLDTLIKLRWLAIFGQILAVLVVHLGFNFPIPLFECLVPISTSVLLNIALRSQFPLSHRLSDGAATALLGYDIIQLSVLLYLTGGLENPFAVLFLAPVMISATALPPRHTLFLGLLAALSATVLALWHEPLPWEGGLAPSLPAYYRLGIWAAILLGIGFTGVYAWRVAQEARELSQALAATELVLAREQHLSQLDGLAAAAAHELGTPLATIALTVRELERELERTGPHAGEIAEDISLIRNQVDRCRQILGKLHALHSDDHAPFESLTLHQLTEEIAAPHRPLGVKIDLHFRGEAPEPTCRRNPGVLYGLGNIVDNAVDFAADTIRIDGVWTKTGVTLVMTDDGPGFPADVLLHAGEPYLSRRPVRTSAEQVGAGLSGGGLGLGLFIAKTLLERSGASIDFTNRPRPDTGAMVRIFWPREAFELGRPRPKSAE